MTNMYIFILVVIFFLALLAIWIDKNTEAKVEVAENGTDVANIKEDVGFGAIKVDETTGCEYLIFRDIMTPRVDETGTKVRGCKESE